jgi:hypothetical protein
LGDDKPRVLLTQCKACGSGIALTLCQLNVEIEKDDNISAIHWLSVTPNVENGKLNRWLRNIGCDVNFER